MTSDLQTILESKRKMRRELACIPIEEKLRMLDMLRERELAIRGPRESTGEGPAADNETPVR